MWVRTQNEVIIDTSGTSVFVNSDLELDYTETCKVLMTLPNSDDTVELYDGTAGECKMVMLDLWEAICRHKDHFDVMREIPKHEPEPEPEPVPEPPKPEISIKQMGLREYTKNRLLGSGIKTLTDLEQRTESELRALNGFGEKCLRDVKIRMAEMGTSLKSG